MKTSLVVHSLSTWEHPNLRLWSPPDPSVVAETVTAQIGHRKSKGSDLFTVRVATPKGLASLTARDGILATRPLLVMERFDYDDLFRWFEATLATCDGDEWKVCVEKLRRHLDWEYDSRP